MNSGGLTEYLLELIGIPHPGPSNYNTAPTTSVHVLRDGDHGPMLAAMRWWLIPYWSKESKTTYSTFNARVESVRKSPAFREPIKRRRCAVPVSGFYEWAKTEGGKQPYYIHPREGDGMLLAGIWDRWKHPETEEVIESFSILTTEAMPGMRFVHTAHFWSGAKLYGHRFARAGPMFTRRKVRVLRGITVDVPRSGLP